ncbi:OLC1v1033048C1 [Oldenlandia corymbosa var. corymbosa]|uniref:OLC1v1033048C1 n=1 Tax=Oldenlandia corymbosa var. corymbosa TaxID=529605 RepID=A0AAV1CMJ0_OLDCO|nr:OLC1v1033048C1 [Oldenlandia corymbosa var. corymbosa]
MVPQPPPPAVNAQYNQQFLNNVLSTRALPYVEDVKWLIRQHLLALSEAYPSLQIKTSSFTHNDGRSVNLLQAEGTVPMVFQNVTYNIPIQIWLMESYPRHAPLVYVTPTPDMIIKRGHPFVSPDGVVSIPYLQNWVYPSSSLVELARNLSHFFGREPPVYSQRRPNPNPNPNPSFPNPNTVAVNTPNPGLGPKPAIPPRVTPPYPPSPYTAGGGNMSGRIMDDPSEVYKRNAMNKLVETVYSDMVGLRKSREAEVEGLISVQAALRQRENQLANGLKEMQDEKEILEQQLQMVLMNADVMETWLKENGEKLGKLGGNVDVDQAFEPCDALSKQLIECTALDLAAEDVLYALDKAVQEGAIPFDQYLRHVRLLSRDQFIHRATSSKIRNAQMHAQVSNMASRISHSYIIISHTMNKSMTIFIFSILWCYHLVNPVRSDASDQRYKPGDPVPLYAIKIGPFHNPSESYQYYDLPFCLPDHVRKKNEAAHNDTNGDPIIHGPYDLDFLVNKESVILCKKTLTINEVVQFRKAVGKDYYFEMYYDDLPIWGLIGRVDREGRDESNYAYLFRHLSEDKEVEAEFTYSVKWMRTNIPFENRLDKFLQPSLPRHLEIHWFSIINSCTIVLLLTGFLGAMLTRIIRNDFIRYRYDENSMNDQEERGWKYIHGDVFRFPKYKSVFAAAIGCGTQLFASTVFIFLLRFVGYFHPQNQGDLLMALLGVNAVTSGIAGYTASSFYRQLEGTDWVQNLLLTWSLLNVPLFLTFCPLNSIAVAFSPSAALPFGTVMNIILLWTLVTASSVLLGGIMGKNRRREFQVPCHNSKYPREIPGQPWYRCTISQMAMAGFFSFSAIYIELYHVLQSVRGHKIDTIFSILFVVFIILLIVTAFVTVALTYFQLAAEDHQWWWRSFLCGGSTGIFIFIYCLFYCQSEMFSFIQTSFFLGYMACICYGFFLMLGTLGFLSALYFVCHIFLSIKLEKLTKWVVSESPHNMSYQRHQQVQTFRSLFCKQSFHPDILTNSGGINFRTNPSPEHILVSLMATSSMMLLLNQIQLPLAFLART